MNSIKIHFKSHIIYKDIPVDTNKNIEQQEPFTVEINSANNSMNFEKILT